MGFKNILQGVKVLDFLAPPIGLNVGGSAGLRTYFGAIMGVLYTASIIALGYFILLTYLDTKNPNVGSEHSESAEYPSVDFVENKLFPVVYVNYKEVVNIPVSVIPKYFTIKLVRYGYKLTTDPVTGKDVITSSFDFFDVVSCKEVMASPVYSQYYKDYVGTKFFKMYSEKYGLCVKVDKPEAAVVSGGGTDSQVQILSYRLMPCSLPGGVGCATLSEMKDIGFIFSTPSQAMNLSDYDHPIKAVPNSENYYYINENLKQKYQSKLAKTEIYDDPGLYFKLKKRTSFFSVDKMITSSRSRDASQTTCVESDVYKLKCDAYINFDFMSSGRSTLIVRHYKGLIESISDLGGVNSIVWIIFLYMNYTYLALVQEKVLAHKVFDFFKEDAFKPRASTRGCCRKKSLRRDMGKIASIEELDKMNSRLNPKMIKQLEGEAYKVINKTLDVITIVKEINSLKVLTHMLLEDYHLKLVPLVSLSLQCKKNKVSLARLNSHVSQQNSVAGSRNMSRKSSAFHNDEFQHIGFGNLDFESALAKVVMKAAASSELNPDQLNLEQKVDNFYVSSLDRAGDIFTSLLKINAENQALAANSRKASINLSSPGDFSEPDNVVDTKPHTTKFVHDKRPSADLGEINSAQVAHAQPLYSPLKRPRKKTVIKKSIFHGVEREKEHPNESATIQVKNDSMSLDASLEQ